MLPVAVADERDALARRSSVEEGSDWSGDSPPKRTRAWPAAPSDHQSKRKVSEEHIGEADHLLYQGKQEHARDPDDVHNREAADMRMPMQWVEAYWVVLAVGMLADHQIGG